MSKFAVGQVLVCKWGWEQTNVDFYQVIAVTSTGRPKMRAIKSEKMERGDSMTGYCIPLVDEFEEKSAPFVRKPIGDDSVKISDYAYASILEKTEIAPGVMGYKPQAFTAYA